MDKDLLEQLKALMGDMGDSGEVVLDRSPENIHLPVDARPTRYSDVRKLGVHARREPHPLGTLTRGLYSFGNGYGLQIVIIENSRGRKIHSHACPVAWFDMLLPEGWEDSPDDFLTPDDCWQCIVVPGLSDPELSDMPHSAQLEAIFEALHNLPDLTVETVRDLNWSTDLPDWATD